jgi:hypothetical protein
MRPTYCIFFQILMNFMLYALRPTFMKSTPAELTSDLKIVTKDESVAVVDPSGN